MDGIILDPRRRPDRGPWRQGHIDAPTPACPRCGGPVELAAGTELAVGTCPADGCRAAMCVYRKTDGRWILAERVPSVRPAAIPTAAGQRG